MDSSSSPSFSSAQIERPQSWEGLEHFLQKGFPPQASQMIHEEVARLKEKVYFGNYYSFESATVDDINFSNIHEALRGPIRQLKTPHAPAPVLPDKMRVDGLSHEFSLPREKVVEALWKQTFEHSCVIVGSPPATGKTSLLQLFSSFLVNSKNYPENDVCLYRIPRNIRSQQEILNGVQRETKKAVKGGINFLQSSSFEALEAPVWILLDDAQNAYPDPLCSVFEDLLKATPKMPTANTVRFVISTTYDISTQGSPVCFKIYPHLSPLPSFSFDEILELFSHWSMGKPWERWTRFAKFLFGISGGHVGVVMAALKMLRTLQEDKVEFDEESACGFCRGGRLFDRLERCFPPPDALSKEQEKSVLDMIRDEGMKDEVMEDVSEEVMVVIPEGEKNFENQSEFERGLRRGGIMGRKGQFTNLAASWYFYNRLYPGRPRHQENDPKSVGELVIRAIQCLPAERLRNACEGSTAKFPKEAVFQHLFNEAFVCNLSIFNTIVPEKTVRSPTKKQKKGGSEGGSVDFFINEEKNWAIELLRLGTQTTTHEHLDRGEEKGKYRSLSPAHYLVVDCTEKKRMKEESLAPNVYQFGKSVLRHPHLYTLHFSETFNECWCIVGTRKVPVLLCLKDGGLRSPPPASPELKALYEDIFRKAETSTTPCTTLQDFISSVPFIALKNSFSTPSTSGSSSSSTFPPSSPSTSPSPASTFSPSPSPSTISTYSPAPVPW